MSKTTGTSNKVEALNLKTIKELTLNPIQRDHSVEFAGIMVREDAEALYIADPQGTWLIDRDDLMYMEDWEGGVDTVSETMRRTGKPVIIGVREDATIHEIRPWRVNKKPGGMGGNEVRQAIERVFTLGGAPLPVSERTLAGENQVAELERLFSRRIGWSPDPHAPETSIMSRGGGVSKTIVVDDGYCDTDCGF